MNLERFNNLTDSIARDELSRCCGARQWVQGMLAARPFRSTEELFQKAQAIWEQLSESDWLEAFSHHPKIGDVSSLRQKFTSTATWAASEQSGATQASETVLQKLQAGNERYERQNGFIFIVCATGKSADEMLALLEKRLVNDRATELRLAATEQAKITRLRLEKLS